MIVNYSGNSVAADVTLELVLLLLPLTTPGVTAGWRYLRLLLRQGRIAGPGPAEGRHAGR